jgi:membrane protease YdiL (CAAX protease family)
MSRIASAAPFVYAVRWRRNVYLGMVVHAALNAISGVILVVSVAQRL